MTGFLTNSAMNILRKLITLTVGIGLLTVCDGSQETCQQMDLTFIVDNTGSMKDSMGPLKTFMKDVVTSINVGEDKTHVACVTFKSLGNSAKPFIPLKLSTSYDSSTIADKIDEIEFADSLSLLENLLQKYDQKVLKEGNGYRSSAKEIAVIVTDGYLSPLLLPRTLTKLRSIEKKSVKFFVVGLRQNHETLSKMTSEENLFELSAMADIGGADFIHQISNNIILDISSNCADENTAENGWNLWSILEKLRIQ